MNDEGTGEGGRWVEVLCAQCAERGEVHVIAACAECGWPPAGDGRCLCFYPEQREWQWRYGEYLADSLPRLRAVKEVSSPPELN
jgi:hypothetical protein